MRQVLQGKHVRHVPEKGMNTWAGFTAAVNAYPWEQAVRLLITSTGARETQLLLSRYRELHQSAFAHEPHGLAYLKRYDILAMHLPHGWEHLIVGQSNSIPQ